MAAPSGLDSNSFSARGYQRRPTPKHRLSFIIKHNHLYNGIASIYLDLLDDYRLAIRIAGSCLCSQPGSLFVLRSHSLFRSTTQRSTYHHHRSCACTVCASQTSEIRSISVHWASNRPQLNLTTNSMRRSQSDSPSRDCHDEGETSSRLIPTLVLPSLIPLLSSCRIAISMLSHPPSTSVPLTSTW